MVLLFGMASAGKSPDILAEALAGLDPAFHVCVVGATGGVHLPTWGRLEDLARSTWSGSLHIVGRYVTEEERRLYYTAADLVLVSHRRGMVTSSGSLRDAISFGRPILASDQFLFGDLVRERGVGGLFLPEDPISLRGELDRTTRLPDAWFEACGERCRQVAREFSWPQIGQLYRDLFEEILTSRAAE